jgi:protein phosphatase
MALRIVEQAGKTDVGRQREANEDTFVIDVPLFAVADGMGGAQAGEIASQMAKEVLESRDEDAGTPEERLIRMIRLANRRIYEKARDDEGRHGMGTTATAAILEGRAVTVGHVGDSRAYRLRDGSLEQLTHDHSLVSELVRSGQLTPEAAENHPQRSIITRALGPEADVEVDAHSHAARDGDVYLLCSDGLTGMVSDREISTHLRNARSLEEAAETLVRAANQNGGKDNITVVLFRVAHDPDAPQEESALAAGDTIHQGLTADDVQTAGRTQERTAVAAPPAPAGRPPSDRRPPRATAASRPAPARARQPAPMSDRTARRRSAPRRIAAALLGVAVTAAIGAALLVGARQVYFVGTDDAGLVTLYRGLPYELPLGLELYSEHYAGSVPARSVSGPRRERLLNHEWRSREDAEDLMRQLERGTLDQGRASE